MPGIKRNCYRPDDIVRCKDDAVYQERVKWVADCIRGDAKSARDVIKVAYDFPELLNACDTFEEQMRLLSCLPGIAERGGWDKANLIFSDFTVVVTREETEKEEEARLKKEKRERLRMKKGALKGLEVALKKATEEICGLEAEILAEGRIRRRVEGLVAHLEETVDLAKEEKS